MNVCSAAVLSADLDASPFVGSFDDDEREGVGDFRGGKIRARRGLGVFEIAFGGALVHAATLQCPDFA